MFNTESGLVKLWVKNIKAENSPYTREMVPNISNLREVVYGILGTEQPSTE